MFQREFQVASAPVVDIVEKDNAYEVTADVPGFDEKNIEVKLQNGSLCIEGERKSEGSEKDFHLPEREVGSFERRFILPEGVDADKIEASLQQGVLTEALPKVPHVYFIEMTLTLDGLSVVTTATRGTYNNANQ